MALKRVVENGRETQSTPRRGSKNNDDDVWLLMNIFSSKDTEYTYPIEEEVIPEGYGAPTIFIQGGSFSYTIGELLTDHDIGRDVNFLFYAQTLYNYEGDGMAVVDLWDATIQQKVRDSEIILLEVNEEAVYNMGSGFYPVLEELLAEPIPETNGEFQVQFRGMGPWESANGVTWRWAYGNSAMLVFENVQPTDTLQVSFWVPFSAYTANDPSCESSVDIDVYLNGQLYQTMTCNEDWIFYTQINSGDLKPGQDNVVEIRSPHTFLGGTIYGTKALSVQILGAGRAE